jgi:hypothetical protein
MNILIHSSGKISILHSESIPDFINIPMASSISPDMKEPKYLYFNRIFHIINLYESIGVYSESNVKNDSVELVNFLIGMIMSTFGRNSPPKDFHDEITKILRLSEKSLEFLRRYGKPHSINGEFKPTRKKSKEKKEEKSQRDYTRIATLD